MAPATLPVVVPPVMGIMLRLPRFPPLTAMVDPSVTFSGNTLLPLVLLPPTQSHATLGTRAGSLRWILLAGALALEPSSTSRWIFPALSTRVPPRFVGLG